MPLIRKPDAKTVPSSSGVVDVRAGLLAKSPDDRWSAARRLGGAPGDAAPLVGALQAEKDARVREALFSALARDGSDEAIGAILSFIRSPDAALRTGALDALATLPGAISTHVENLLADADPDVRILSCDLARRLPAAEANHHLSALLKRESAANVCAAAVEVLSEVGDSSVLPALAACAARFASDGFLPFAIEEVTRRIGNEHAQPPASV
jgi:HEAT repeat protein